MTDEASTISREVTNRVGKYVAEFSFGITPDARISEDEIRRQCAIGAADMIAYLMKHAPQVLI